jgi:hypothetical protein
MIIDAHLHLSIMQKEKNFEEVKKRLLLDMNKNKISKAIVIPDNLHGTSCADLDVLENILGKNKKFLIIATLRVDEINSKNLKKIEVIFKSHKAVGFKIFPGHDPIYPTDKRWLPVIKLCKKYDVPFIIHTGINLNDKNVAKYNDPKYISELAKNNKTLKIVVCHYFWPKINYCFDQLKKFTNVYFDTSALAHEEVIKECGGIKNIQRILEKTMENRKNSLIFGTDWPIVSFEKSIGLINSLNLSQNQKEKIFSENANAVFSIKNGRDTILN